jgi:hypothetical protein
MEKFSEWAMNALIFPEKQASSTVLLNAIGARGSVVAELCESLPRVRLPIIPRVSVAFSSSRTKGPVII